MKRLLEVESKFRFEKSLLPRFRLNQGFPPFSSLTFMCVHRFGDTYLDHNNVLSKNGIYTLEAKKRISGCFTHSVFEELTNANEIRNLVLRYLPDRGVEGRHLGLDVLARFSATRESYIADDKFTVDMDSTNFSHSVGEVELTAENAELAHREIDSFLKRYAWFCLGRPVQGKLSACFDHTG